MKARFKAQIWRAGNANVLTVPVQYLKDNVVELDREYQVTISEIEEAAQDGN